MRNLQLIVIVLTGLLSLNCTTFVLESSEQLVFGKNLDWKSSTGMIIVNKRNIAKTALILPPARPMKWISKYGSISFNQFGKEFPFGGMNEKGLVIELMIVNGNYPSMENRPALNELQWIQFQLDQSQTVEEVIQNNELVNIQKINQVIHFLIADSNGNKAVIEFDKNGSKVYQRDQLPYPVLENNTYPVSLEKLSNGNNCRFKSVVDLTNNIKPESNFANEAFLILDHVKLQGSWSIVYDIRQKQIHFKTDVHPTLRMIRMDYFNFSCSQPTVTYDLSNKDDGDITTLFLPYREKENKRIFDLGLTTNEIVLPNQLLARFYNYNNQCSCMEME